MLKLYSDVDVSNIANTIREEGYRRLPLDYQEVEYIQSTGTQWIDTGFIPTNSTQTEIKFAYNSSGNNSANVAGCQGSSGGRYLPVIAITDKIQTCLTTETYSPIDIDNFNTNTHQIIFNENTTHKVKYDGNIVGEYSYNSLMPTTPLILFANRNVEGNISSNSIAKIYLCKMNNNGVLVRNFIPCYRKSDNVIGLYDTVNNVFYTNAGTGTFLKGNDVNNLLKVREMPDAIKNIVDKYKNNNPTSTVTNGVLTNALDVPVKNYKVFGNSTQNTTTGKNKLDTTGFTNKSSSGITITNNYDGDLLQSIKISGNPTETSWTTMKYVTFEAGTYIISGLNVSQSGKTGLRMGLHFDSARQYFINANSPTYTFTLDEPGTAQFVIWVQDVNKFPTTDTYITPMIRLASISDDTYEPYTNGASPNPSYPQQIYSVGDLVIGKNLFNFNSISSVNPANARATINNQIIHIDNINISEASIINVAPRFTAINLPAGTYYISVDIKSNSGTFSKINDGALDWELVQAPTLSSNYQRYVYRHRYDNSYSLDKMLIQLNATNASDTFDITNIMISSSSDTTYEPYYGKYKVPVKISGKNLLNYNIYSYDIVQSSLNGGSVRIENGKLIIDGTNATARMTVRSRSTGVSERTIIPVGTYYCELSFNGSLINDDGTKTFMQFQTNIKTFEKDYEFSQWFITCNIGEIKEIPLQLEEGTTATAYEPYHTPITTNIYLDEPLRGIGTVKDYIDFSTGKRHNLIGNVVLNGSENWEKRTASHNYRFSCNALSSLAKGASSNDTKANLISNYFKIITADNSYSENDGDGISLDVSSTIFIFFDQYKQSSLQDFKTWLSSHNIELGYELATPTEQNITLPQLHLFEGTNIIEIGTETQATTEVVYITKAV